MSDAPTRLFFVRHAETEWNAARRFQGHLDSELTPRGIQQALALAERLASEGVRALYSSDQRRCLRTARVIANRLGIEVVPRADLREIDCGEWTGRSYDEVQTLWPEHHDNWRNHPERHRMPGGESIAEVQQRALAFVEEVRRRHPGETVLAITHNTDVRVAVCYLRGRPLSRMWEGERQPNCAINLLRLSDGRTDLLAVADVDHLATLGSTGIAPTA